MKDDTKFRQKMMETVDEETLEWAQKASKEFVNSVMQIKPNQNVLFVSAMYLAQAVFDTKGISRKLCWECCR